MINFNTNVSFDSGKIRQQLEGGTWKAQAMLDAQVLTDSNFYCPLKESPLQKSAQIYTRIGSGEVIWRTPYARAQYYGVNYDHSKSKNPNACAKWFEAAKARHEKDWERLVDECIKRS